MKRIAFIVLSVFALADISLAACGGSSPTWTAASANQTDVAACVTGATTGDTINIPSGTASGGSGRTTINKELHLVGAGIASTTLDYGFYITTGGNNTSITGIFFSSGTIKITSGTDWSGTPITGWRIYGNRFDTTGNYVIDVRNGSTGLIDNNIFNTTASDTTISVYGRDGTDWSNASDWGGTGRYVFIEDNLFTEIGTTWNHAVLGTWGASYVARCNKTNGGNDTFDAHGYGHGTNRHGARAYEVYGNRIINQDQTRAMQWRGGSGRVFTNRWDSCSAACQSSTYSAAGAGISLFDNRMPGSANNLAMAYPSSNTDCTATSSSTCASGDQSACCSGHEAYPCCGQVGRGQSGSGTNNQALDPLYIWDNVDDAANAVGISIQTGAEAYLTLNTDYYTSGAPAGYTPYTYPHPSRSIAATTTCLSGDNSQADTGITFWANGPVRSNGSPSSNVDYTATVTLSLDTDVNSTCKYDTTPDTAYASMAVTMTGSGTRNHSKTSVAVTPGATNTFYVRCIGELEGIPNSTDFVISFTVLGESSSIMSIGTGGTVTIGAGGTITIQ